MDKELYMVEAEYMKRVLEHVPVNLETLTNILPEAKIAEWLINEKKYFEYLNGLILLQKGTIRQYLDIADDLNPAGMASISTLDKFMMKNISERRGQLNDIVKSIYTKNKVRKLAGFKMNNIMDAADKHALRFLQNYNFDQVMNLHWDLRGQIRQTIWKGVLEGKTPRSIGLSLTNVINDPLPVIDKATGKVRMLLSARERALLIARTETMRAVNQGSLIAFQQFGVDSVSIQNVSDGRLCNYCASIGRGGPYGLDNVPYLPAHPRCRCRYQLVHLPGMPHNLVYREPESYINLVTNSRVMVEG